MLSLSEFSLKSCKIDTILTHPDFRNSLHEKKLSHRYQKEELDPGSMLSDLDCMD